jgi:quercetin dioxygenase-like cupin family protein
MNPIRNHLFIQTCKTAMNTNSPIWKKKVGCIVSEDAYFYTMQQPGFIEDKQFEWQPAGDGIRRKIIAYDPSLMLVKVDFEQGAVGALHKHKHVQITHIESGVFEVEIGHEKKILKAGDGFHIPSNIEHGVVCLEKGVLIDVFSPMREDFIH